MGDRHPGDPSVSGLDLYGESREALGRQLSFELQERRNVAPDRWLRLLMARYS